MESGWSVVGAAVTAAYEERGWAQADLVRESGISDATIRKIERGHEQRYRSSVKRAIELALEWPIGHIDAILRGEQAQPVNPPVGVDHPAAQHQLTALAGKVDELVGRFDQLQELVERVLGEAAATSKRRAAQRARQSTGGRQ